MYYNRINNESQVFFYNFSEICILSSVNLGYLVGIKKILNIIIPAVNRVCKVLVTVAVNSSAKSVIYCSTKSTV